MMKKNGKLRVYVDFRDLNATTPKDMYVMAIDSCHSRVIRNQQNLYPIFLLLP